MIKKIQRKFIAIAMLSMFIVTAFIVGTINAVNIYRQTQEADVILNLISSNDGVFPHYFKQIEDINNIAENTTTVENSISEELKKHNITPETEHMIRYVSIKVDENNNIISSDLEHISSVNDNNLDDVVSGVINKGKTYGFYSNFKYLITEKDGFRLIVLLDFRNYSQTQSSILLYSATAGITALIIVFILVSVFSKKAIEPLIENEEKQKQFVTNAGHELKTPVAIILANSEVLKMKNGNDEWIQSIENQANRLNILIKGLLKLAKLGENGSLPNFDKINLSNLVEKVVNSMRIISKKHELIMDIQKNIEINADEEMIYELISILIDNSIKYVTENGKINITLKNINNSIVKLDVSNDCENLTKQDCEKLFQRFYRKEQSRDRKKGGYGIGLSMAERIVEIHKGKISANYENGVVHFVVNFSK